MNRNRILRQIALRERAEEDRYFTARDRELIRKLHERTEEQDRTFVRDLARGRCPECGERLRPEHHRGVGFDACPEGHGMWMTEVEMRTLARREHDSWIGRYFYRPKALG
jgi:hypothetical protein